MSSDDVGVSAAAQAEAESRSPVHWPSLTADEIELQWPVLREWVEQLLVRFPHCPRVPECWWRHNDLVELFSALRDCERGSFASVSPAAAAMNWQRALRDVELRAETWIRRFTCTIPGRQHPASSGQADWAAFVAADVRARRLAWNGDF